MTKYIVSIDQGTTSCRSFIFDKDGKTSGMGQKEFAQHHPQPGWKSTTRKKLRKHKSTVSKSREVAIKGEDIAAAESPTERETTVVGDNRMTNPFTTPLFGNADDEEAAEKLRSDSSLREKTGRLPTRTSRD